MIGIENVNEFYTNHYLTAILGGEVRRHLAAWGDADGEDDGDADRDAAPDADLDAAPDADRAAAPWRRLARLQRDYFRHLEALDRLRPSADRVPHHLRMTGALLDALGYSPAATPRRVDAGPLPLLGALDRGNGEPLLWLLPVPSPHPDRAPEGGLLAGSLAAAQFDHGALPRADLEMEDRLELDDGTLRKVLKPTIEDLVSDAFQQETPPRFILLMGDREWILADRGKWAEQRLLRFDWEEILGRRDRATLDAVTALLHRDALAPASGTSLVDTFDDSSHKHAYEVSEDLKYALQASIEVIGNEAIRYRREISKQKVYGDEIDGQGLAIECIRFMYRVLFLLYIEARPELGYAPMGSEAYRLGYSFERLRDLELLELETDEAREGYTLDLWLRRLFDMVYHGTPEPPGQQALAYAAPDAASLSHGFRLEPLKSHLFDPERTPFLNKVKLRNKVLLRMVRAMSLSRPPKEARRGKRRGRISYATLGINQLGAVYEALLSFRGFFAEETLYEVKPAKTESPDPIRDPAFFVTEAELGQYSDKERVFDRGKLRRYPPGAFIYRMAGRDRQKSASYYTPEVLTRCLVKYALKELLEDADGRPRHARAEELLDLTLCEPAMGSAAFLNEAINQLAERYLQRRQQELGERIPHERYARELQKVRMYLADNNVYGVDLNPVAVELAEVSLWLNAIYARDTRRGREVFVPWFGGQLCAGNSLIGCWRKVFSAARLDAGAKDKESPWLDAVPERVALGAELPVGSVLHFLLPDRGMAVYGQGAEGKPIREMCGAELKAIAAWRKEICRPLSEGDREALVKLSEAADRLWAKHTELLAKIRRRTTDPQSVYGHEHALAGAAPTSTREKDEIWRREMASEQVRASSPYRRLRLAMDYWCALWFWPIEQADLLPDRDEWLTDMALLLDSDVLPSLGGGGEAQRELFPETMPADEARELVEEVGFADVERLIERWPRLRMADGLRERYRFHHWELEFADLFLGRGGFDLILGNPPWVRVQWQEAVVMGDLDPSFVLHKLSAAQAAKRRKEPMERAGFRSAYLGAHEDAASTQAYLSAFQCYPELQGVKVNLYKAFLPQCWGSQSENGVVGLLHPEKVYDEPGGGAFRRASYQRLRQHYQFQNELKLFPEVHNQTRFSVNIYSFPGKLDFVTISNLFFPNTIDLCHQAGTSRGPVPGLKDNDNKWDLSGHSGRIVTDGGSELELFSDLLDENDTPPEEARLPAVHSSELIPALRAFTGQAEKLGALGDSFFITQHFNETYAQKDGTISRDTTFVEAEADMVLSGPHFYVGNPFYKTPKAVCSSNKAYDVIDLVEMPPEYIPRTNYVPACESAEYRSRAPKVPWSEAARSSDYFRIVVPNMIGPGSERTLQAAIIPPGPGHIHTVNSYAFSGDADLLAVAACWMSLPFDFFIKSTGAEHFQPNLARRIPILRGDFPERELRVLMLNCLTQAFEPLWSRCWKPVFSRDRWTTESPRLTPLNFRALSELWARDSSVRNDFSRRQALLELDVIVAMQLGWSLEQLQTAYRSLFFVMQNYERDTWYDMNGRIIFTNNGTGLPGVGLPRTKKKDDPNPCWTEVQHMTEESGHTGSETITQTILDDTLPGGPREKTITYQAPWTRCNREQDYETAWRHFEKRFAEQGRTPKPQGKGKA